MLELKELRVKQNVSSVDDYTQRTYKNSSSGTERWLCTEKCVALLLERNGCRARHSEDAMILAKHPPLEQQFEYMH
jgi:hypothetical protein